MIYRNSLHDMSACSWWITSKIFTLEWIIKNFISGITISLPPATLAGEWDIRINALGTECLCDWFQWKFRLKSLKSWNLDEMSVWHEHLKFSPAHEHFKRNHFTTDWSSRIDLMPIFWSVSAGNVLVGQLHLLPQCLRKVVFKA